MACFHHRTYSYSYWERLVAPGTSLNPTTQESGVVLDSTAFDFCKYGQRTCKLHHFYMWMKWKKEDLLFLSNSLAVGVAADGNACTPYVREKTSGETNSAKSSASERKAAKASQNEKMMGSIGKRLWQRHSCPYPPPPLLHPPATMPPALLPMSPRKRRSQSPFHSREFVK
jgi:hypothetical protein